MVLANPPQKKANMAKKRAKKHPKKRNTSPTKSNPHRRGSRRRRNPDGGMSVWSLIGGFVGGGVVAGVTDYALAGTAMMGTPTRRALAGGGVALLTGVGAAMTKGNARGVLAGVTGAFAGVAGTNTVRSLSQSWASKDEKAATGDDKSKKPDTSKPNADAGRQMGLVPNAAMRGSDPARLEAPRKVQTLDRGGLRALVPRASRP